MQDECLKDGFSTVTVQEVVIYIDLFFIFFKREKAMIVRACLMTDLVCLCS